MTTHEEVDKTKRAFMKKFGTYAATAPLGMYILMTPSTSAHASSCVTNATPLGVGSSGPGFSFSVTNPGQMSNPGFTGPNPTTSHPVFGPPNTN